MDLRQGQSQNRRIYMHRERCTAWAKAKKVSAKVCVWPSCSAQSAQSVGGHITVISRRGGSQVLIYLWTRYVEDQPLPASFSSLVFTAVCKLECGHRCVDLLSIYWSYIPPYSIYLSIYLHCHRLGCSRNVLPSGLMVSHDPQRRMNLLLVHSLWRLNTFEPFIYPLQALAI